MAQYIKATVLIVFIVAATVWFVSQQQEEVINLKEDPALKAAINSCEGITERAAADLVAIVEFQKLEIAGRKAHVFKMCMGDRGYTENPSWLTYSKPIASITSKETTVSADATLESLRRVDMFIASGEQKRPSYWIRRKENP